jgi:glutamine amidotransferase
MCTKSEEGEADGFGLNWVNAEVLRFPNEINSNKVKIPHIAWSKIEVKKNNKLFQEEVINRFYFVHAYYVHLMESQDALSTSNYGIEFCSSFQKDNIFGVQFHPEKSHKYGMQLFKEFVLI